MICVECGEPIRPAREGEALGEPYDTERHAGRIVWVDAETGNPVCDVLYGNVIGHGPP